MIQVKNVSKKYGNFEAVKNISFEVGEGEIVGFLGPNGAGKSTTMNMITGFIEPSDGQIIVDGFDIGKKPKKAKKQIGYMPENVPLYNDLTVKEFITYMADLKLVKRSEKKAEINRVIEATHIKDVENKLIKNISRGYKQRVSLAGALVGNPKILILDEPTVGLDPKQVTEIRELIRSLKEKHTVILSSHILSEVSQMCNKIIIINNGEIVSIGTPEEIESQSSESIFISVVVEDDNNKFEGVVKHFSKIKNCKFEKQENNSKYYELECDSKDDIRKELFKECAKEDVVIIEMKKKESSLEDAFLKLIDKEGGEN
ncbi:MAG: ABC transporter ATP-binding protein [Clostridia bacterium]|nr:ABC transporter ATP-binding protein [Clostridia bacterium]